MESNFNEIKRGLRTQAQFQQRYIATFNWDNLIIFDRTVALFNEFDKATPEKLSIEESDNNHTKRKPDFSGLVFVGAHDGEDTDCGFVICQWRRQIVPEGGVKVYQSG